MSVLKLSKLLTHSDKDLAKANDFYDAAEYQKAQEIYNIFAQNYHQDPDILHNLACAFFMQQKYTEALSFFKQSVGIIWSYHSTYHFIASALYYNLGLELIELKKAEEAQKSFIKSEFLYHQNQDALNALGGKISFSKQNPEAHFYKVQNVLGDLQIFGKNPCLMTEIDAEHFSYHCNAANQFLNRGLCFLKLNQSEIARSDFVKARDFDEKNPDNMMIEDALSAST